MRGDPGLRRFRLRRPGPPPRTRSLLSGEHGRAILAVARAALYDDGVGDVVAGPGITDQVFDQVLRTPSKGVRLMPEVVVGVELSTALDQPDPRG